MMHWLRHLLGWTFGYVDHYVGSDGHLYIAHFCGTCREPIRESAIHSAACDCVPLMVQLTQATREPCAATEEKKT